MAEDGASNPNRDDTLWPGNNYAEPASYANADRRHRSFDTWPEGAPRIGRELAVNGFVYTGWSDEVRCHFCGLVLRNWSRRDIPASRHHQGAPFCEMVNERSNRQYDENDMYVDVHGPCPSGTEMKTSSSDSDPDLLPDGLETDGLIHLRRDIHKNRHLEAVHPSDTDQAAKKDCDNLRKHAVSFGYAENEIELTLVRLRGQAQDINIDNFFDEITNVRNELILQESMSHTSSSGYDRTGSTSGYSGDDENSSSSGEE